MKNKLSVGLAILFVTSFFLIISCNKGNGYGVSNPPAAANTIYLSGMTFSPATLPIKAGTRVTWNNNNNTAHTVTADDNSFDSGNLAAGKTYTRILSAMGSYPCHCTIHSDMTGTIVVQPYY